MEPFTYVLKWSGLNLRYYGCRYADGCSPGDLFTTYFTSSKKVKELLDLGVYPDVLRVTGRFGTEREALYHEHKILKRVGAKTSPLWLNDSNGYPDIFSWKGKSRSEETKRKISDSKRGRKNPKLAIAKQGTKASDQTRKKMSETRKGRVLSEETRTKISESHKGKKFSPEHRHKLSEAAKKRRRK